MDARPAASSAEESNVQRLWPCVRPSGPRWCLFRCRRRLKFTNPFLDIGQRALELGRLLLERLHFLLSRGLALLEVTGRHTGRRYAIPVGYQRERGAIIVMVSEARHIQWWRNFYEPAPVGIRLRGRELHGTAELVPPGS